MKYLYFSINEKPVFSFYTFLSVGKSCVQLEITIYGIKRIGDWSLDSTKLFQLLILG